jgi:DNA polymerase-3 subunit chi
LKAQVHFFILNKSYDLKKSICQIIKIYYKQKYKIVVKTNDKPLLSDLDDMLWTFEQISFIPHCTRYNFDEEASVLLCDDKYDYDANKYNVLFNLNMKEKEKNNDFGILIEIVTQNESQKDYAREKYTYYKNNNIDIKYENL